MSVNRFSGRWSIILASLGMAVGAGNLWRFPRLAGQYGGAFIILWMLFLFIWSIPLLMSEFAIGKSFRKSVIGSFGKVGGQKASWMGFFVAICTLAIAFYYSIVVAWSLRYLGISIAGLFDDWPKDHAFLSEQWQAVSNGSWKTVCVMILVILLGVVVISQGIKKGLELANKILVPSLFILLIIISISALNLPNGIEGVRYMFHVDTSLFFRPNVWIEALSQSAWSTGAGWGLLMTISTYARNDEEVTFNVFAGAIGNNIASILAGLAILPAVFALSVNSDLAIKYLQSGSQSLAFITIPQLFATISGGSVLTVIFFLALSLAAFTSLLSMFELMSRHLTDLGIYGRTKWAIIMTIFIIFGIPSAYSLNFFNNQDWVWGIGLVLSGFFVAILILLNKAQAFKLEYIDAYSDLKLPHWFFRLALIAVVLSAPVLITWWMSQGYSSNPWFDQGSWNWSDTYSNASIVTQWSAVILLGLILNRWLFRKFSS